MTENTRIGSIMVVIMHTPGPWEVHKYKLSGRAQAVNDQNGNRIADCALSAFEHEEPLDDGQREANANLIASAPELLGACKFALTWIKEIPEARATEIRLNEAIQKAEGRA